MMNRRQLVHASAVGAALLGPGSRHFDWATVERATKQGFWPDTLSTDWNVTSKTIGVIDFPNVMSKFSLFGLPLKQTIACATFNATRLSRAAARATWLAG